MADKKRAEQRQNVRTTAWVRVDIRYPDAEEINKISALKEQPLAVRDELPPKSSRNITGFSEWSAMTIADTITELNEKKDLPIFRIYDFLSMMDDKLDRIIEMIEKGKENKRIEVKEAIDISASGIGMVIETPIEKGKLIDITLRIPGFPFGKLKTYGEVVRVDQRRDGKRNLFDVGVEFVGISKEEQEGLIAFIFSQQRKMIRQSSTKK